MRILTLSLCLSLAFSTITFGQDEAQSVYLNDLREVVEVSEEQTTVEKDGMVYLVVEQGKKDNMIKVKHITGEGSYSTRSYYLTPEGVVVNGVRSAIALPDGEWVYYENNKAVKKQWFVKGEFAREKIL